MDRNDAPADTELPIGTPAAASHQDPLTTGPTSLRRVLDPGKHSSLFFFTSLNVVVVVSQLSQ